VAMSARHGSFGCGLDEVGQTNAPTVGPNFLFALQKGDVEARGATRFMCQDLRKMGFNAVAKRLEPLAAEVSKNASMEAKEKLWRQCANEYTREGSPCLYRTMNKAIREDGPAILGRCSSPAIRMRSLTWLFAPRSPCA